MFDYAARYAWLRGLKVGDEVAVMGSDRLPYAFCKVKSVNKVAVVLDTEYASKFSAKDGCRLPREHGYGRTRIVPATEEQKDGVRQRNLTIKLANLFDTGESRSRIEKLPVETLRQVLALLSQ